MTSLNRGPAKIYAFPPRGRFASVSGRTEAYRPEHTPPRVLVASSSAWYHDEAMRSEVRRDAEPVRQN